MAKHITIKIDMKEIQDKIQKYIYKKVQKELRENMEYDPYAVVDVDFPNVRISYPDIVGRLEKLEDWKLDIEQGWIKVKSNIKKR